MSSPKTAAAKPARRTKAGQATAAPSGATAPAKAGSMPEAAAGPAADDAGLSAEARRLAAEIERALAAGRPEAVAGEAFQALMAALCRSYAAQVEQGAEVLPLKERGNVTSTDIMLMASGLLRSANLAVFELGMWQSWTGR